MGKINNRWLLKDRPKGMLSEDDFEWVEQALPALRDGEALVRHIYLAIAPTNRLWAGENDSYMPSVELGQVMRGMGIGIVEESLSDSLNVGDFVWGQLNWQTYAVVNGQELSKIEKVGELPLAGYHALLGSTGMAAYFGLMDIGRPKRGEVLVVSAAAGAVGSLVGQIGKIEGCYVVGIAGSDSKCKLLTDELGFDAAINYKSENVSEMIKQYCPNGVDIYFDNVGGEVLDAVLGNISVGARIPICGLISSYNSGEHPGMRNFLNVLVKRATLKGYIVIDYVDRAKEAFDYLLSAYLRGEIKYSLDVTEGLENVPEALNGLFLGKNNGKSVVKIDTDWVDE